MAEPVIQTIAQNLTTLANNLDLHMRFRGMSEMALAKATGISPRTVGNFLRPNNRQSKRGTSKSFPSGTLANLVKLADALGVEAWELLCNRDAARARYIDAIEHAYIDRQRAEAAADAPKPRTNKPPLRRR